MTIKCYAAVTKGQLLENFEYEPESLGPFDVELKISHCGICHSDLHLIDNDWGFTEYPFVPGHEIVGEVVDLGDSVNHLNRGQRVGVGWQCQSCMHCEWCERGDHNQCAQQQATCVGHYGGFARSIRCDSRFVIPIPNELASADVAPMFCGGATVYSPLRQHIISPTMRVVVVGIGGLGHMALQFARAFGCHVTAFSHSPDKEEEALELGADEFVATCDASNDQELLNSFDLILYYKNKKLD